MALDAVLHQGAHRAAYDLRVAREFVPRRLITELHIIVVKIQKALDHVPVLVAVGGCDICDVLEHLIDVLQTLASGFHFLPCVEWQIVDGGLGAAQDLGDERPHAHGLDLALMATCLAVVHEVEQIENCLLSVVVRHETHMAVLVG